MISRRRDRYLVINLGNNSRSRRKISNDLRTLRSFWLRRCRDRTAPERRKCSARRWYSPDVSATPLCIFESFCGPCLCTALPRLPHYDLPAIG
mmetsp:Transcript_115034/g.229035  ORF Transcript_115034/g.229035 Transcript_115034/m.229035 type:complete len:93 (-) Transcript_115034:23-301(-)